MMRVGGSVRNQVAIPHLFNIRVTPRKVLPHAGRQQILRPRKNAGCHILRAPMEIVDLVHS